MPRIGIGIGIGRTGGGITLAQQLKAKFSAIGFDAVRWAAPGADFETLSGADVTQWRDLTGNGHHATDGTDRPTFVEVPGGDSYIAFTGANNDNFNIPFAQATNATKYSVAVSFRSAGSGTYNTIFNLYRASATAGLTIKYYSATVFVTVGTVTGSVTGVLANTDHMIVVTFDGTVETASERVRIFIDDAARSWDTPQAWPASLGATFNVGRIGQLGNGTQDFTGRMHFVAEAYTAALTPAQVAAAFAIAREHLSYTDAWVDTGTSLTEHTLAALTIDPTPIALTATGYTVTAAAPITAFDHTTPHVGFTDIRTVAADSYQIAFRHGAAHSDVTGAIQLVTSTGGYAVGNWGAPAGFVDTAGVDDRDNRFATLGGVASVLYSINPDPGAVGQVFSLPVAGGTPANVFGYPLSASAQKFTFQGWAADDGALVGAYGGPDGVAGYLCVKVGGTDIYWTPGAYDGANFVRLFEPHAIRLSGVGGDLLCAARTGWPATATWAPVLLRSEDGTSWTECRRFPAIAGDTATLYIDSPILLEVPTLGVIVMVGRRRAVATLTLLYSADGGVTWSEPTDIVAGTGLDDGYAGGVVVSDGASSAVLLFSYYTSTAIHVVEVTIDVSP